jgi:Protein of unknown function (DUF2541)
MFRRLAVVLCALLAVCLVIETAEAHKRKKRWRSNYSGDQLVVIAEQDVDLSLSRFEVDVRSAKGGYRGIRLRNKSARLFDVSRATLVYGDSGRPHEEDRQIDMYRGERSKTIPQDLSGDSRFIDRVIIDQVPSSGRGKIQILGIQDSNGRSMDRAGGGFSSGGGVSTAPRPPATDPALSGDLTVRPTQPTPTPTAPGVATDGGDVLFGAQYVGFGVDRDVIRVGNEIGKFDRIRLRVLDNDIHINEIKVVYANGETDALAVDADIPKNSRTNWIDLKGDRFIKEIQMVYRSKPSFRGQARIEVFGQYAPGWLGPQGEGRKYNQGWVLLGAQTAGFVGFDRDVIPVGKNEGGFKRLRVTVRDRAITLNEIRVVYSDGTDETIPIRTRVDAGGTFGPIDLKGERRQAIERVEAKYRSRIFSAGKGSAIVEVWGLH